MDYSDVHATVSYNGAGLNYKARIGPTKEARGEAVIMITTLKGQLNVRAIFCILARISCLR